MDRSLRETLETSWAQIAALRSFLNNPVPWDGCRETLRRGLRTRNEHFLTVLEQAVFANPDSPYQRLFRRAGTEFQDVARSVHQDGIERTLERLYAEGVYVGFEEFKGRVPVRRTGLEFGVRPEDFDNPLVTQQFRVKTRGSRSVTRRGVNLHRTAHDAVHQWIFLEAFGLEDRPTAVWRPVPPGGTAGFSAVLRHAKIGKRVERWFSQSVPRWRQVTFLSAIYASKAMRIPLPVPEHVPLNDAAVVAAWLAEKCAQGHPGMLDTNASSGVRVCLAARASGLDISGSFLRLGGEPYTQAKARVVAEAGCRAVANYAIVEVGRIALACAAPAALDDAHVLSDKVAVIQQEKPIGTSGLSVGAFYLTALLPLASKILLNVETDDYGVLEERDCGCLFGELGLTRHLSEIRSYDKLTSEGMTFRGSELLALVEEVLPSRFGGHPSDYQFVEEEDGALVRTIIAVSPRVGAIDEPLLIDTVLGFLRSGNAPRQMAADRWRDAQTLRVIRREPYATGTAKILPLHILQQGSSSAARGA